MTKHRDRSNLLRRGVRLQIFSIAWDVVEGFVAVTAAIISGSITLMGFGLESLIEITAAGTVYWRLRKELKSESQEGNAERRALQIVAVCFLILAGYIGFDGISSLMAQEGPESSTIGMAMAAAAFIVMPFLQSRNGERAEHWRARRWSRTQGKLSPPRILPLRF